MEEFLIVIGVIGTVLGLWLFGFIVGGFAGEAVLKDKMIECHKLTGNAEQCYSFIILNDKGQRIQ